MTEIKKLEEYGLKALYARYGNDHNQITAADWALNTMESELNRLAEELESTLKTCERNAAEGIERMKKDGALASFWFTGFSDVQKIEAQIAAVKKQYESLKQFVELAKKEQA